MSPERRLIEVPKFIIQPKPVRTVIVEAIAKSHPRTEVQGVDNIHKIKELLDQGVPVIGIFNHLSHLDAPLIFTEFKNVEPDLQRHQVFIMGSVIWENPLTHYLMQAYPGIMVPSQRRKPAEDDAKSWGIRLQWQEEADKETIKVLSEGNLLLLSPEGGRSKNKKGLREPSHRAARYFYFVPNIHLVPIALWNTERFLPPDTKNIIPRVWYRPHLSVGKPISVQDLEKRVSPSETIEENDQKLVNAMMLEVARLLPEEYRGYLAEQLATTR